MDHAGIATQAKVEKKLFETEKKTREDLGRSDFYKLILNWKNDYANLIREQWDKLGLALDYEKEKFTLDSDVNNFVNKTFIDLYKKGVIYKGEKIVNWDIKLNTAISNIEIEHKIIPNSYFYYIKYYLNSSDSEYVVVATTRPETIFGDAAIFVNPSDKRYSHLIGKDLKNPLNSKPLKVIADKYVEKDFGTGVMKCTPAHDFNDYELAKKYKLEYLQIMDNKAILNNYCNEFKGMDRYKARAAIVKKLEKENLLEKKEPYKLEATVSQRSGEVVEPLISNQWFIDLNKMAEKVSTKLDKKKLKFFPEKFNKDFSDWIHKADQWCISRQLWWGHQIPAWYEKKDKLKENPIVQLESPGSNYYQDQDVLDTWFSSSLWPIIMTKNHLNNKKEPGILNNETSLLVTGYDLIFFWVAKMVFMNLFINKNLPFSDVLIHGLIRDKNGLKMSKSLGNGVDPISVIDKYGNDALRLFLLSSSSPGADINFSEAKIKDNLNFLNKWLNISKFIQKNISINEIVEYANNKPKFKNSIDRSIYNFILKLKAKQENFLEKKSKNQYNILLIAKELTEFIWNTFANKYLEITKETKNFHEFVYQFFIINQMLAPFTPYLCEKIYQSLMHTEDKQYLSDSVFIPNQLINLKKGAKKIKKLGLISFFELIEFWENDLTRIVTKHKMYLKQFAIQINLKGPKKEAKDIENYFNRKYKLNTELTSDWKVIYENKYYGSFKILTDLKHISQEDTIKSELKFFTSELERSKKILANKAFKTNKPDLYKKETIKNHYYQSTFEKLKQTQQNLNHDKN